MIILLYILLGLLGIILAYILLLVVSALLVDKNREYTQDSRYYRWLLNSATGIGLMLCRVSVDFTGADKIPEGRFLLVSNHRSKFDPLVTWYMFRKENISFITKESNLHVPVFGRIVRRCCFLAIDRQDIKKAYETINKITDLAINDVASIGIYPEGTRNYDFEENGLLPFRNGAFKPAKKAGIPIVIVTVQGTEKIHTNYPWHHTVVSLDVSGVISAEEVASMNTAQIGAIVRQKILETTHYTEEKEHEVYGTV